MLHRALSEREESRLVLYLDDALLQIQRDFQKRREPSSALARLPAFLRAWDTPWELISSVPLLGSSAALRDAYLLRLTSEVTEGIVGYSVARADAPRDAELTLVLYWLDLLDRTWAARMNREALDLRATRAAAHAAYPWDAEPHALQETQRTASASLRPATSAVSTPRPADTASFQQTDRIRLREVLVSAREQVFRWMRRQLGEKEPPRLDDAPAADPVDGVVREAASRAETYTQLAGRKRRREGEEGEEGEEGVPEGEPEGVPEGEPEGVPEGEPEGVPEGESEGVPEGFPEGFPEGEPEQEPEPEPEQEPHPEPEPDSHPDPTHYDDLFSKKVRAD